MTVSELIEVLKGFDPEQIVIVKDHFEDDWDWSDDCAYET
jgi:hypothetical protein